MRKLNGHVLLSLVLALTLFTVPSLHSDQSRPAQRAAPEIWFGPAPGSLDMLQMFETTAEWPVAFQRVSVFKFNYAHVLGRDDRIAGPNTYGALVAVDAFRRITAVWRRQIAVGVGAVKPQYCTSDATGMTAAVNDSIQGINNVAAAGGQVQYLAMDEPFLSGTNPPCGDSDPASTLERLTQYVRGVHAASPAVRIGLIEPYPYFSATRLASFVERMRNRGITPAFFHVDVDLHALEPGRDDIGRDLRLLATVCALLRIPFGVIVWGTNGDADSLYIESALRLAQTLHDAFGDWQGVPSQLVVESWAASGSGLLITPTNLPETDPNAHTHLLNQVVHVLRGGSDVGLARPRVDANYH